MQGKGILQGPDPGTGVLDNTRPFWHSSIRCFWMLPAHSKEHKYNVFGVLLHQKSAFTNTGMFQYLGHGLSILKDNNIYKSD